MSCNLQEIVPSPKWGIVGCVTMANRQFPEQVFKDGRALEREVAGRFSPPSVGGQFDSVRYLSA